MPQCTVHDLNSDGEGVASLDGYTLFVAGALPQEVVEVEIFEQKKNYGRARLLKVIKPSPQRITPPCPIYNSCGGCQIMHLDYNAQLQAKTKRVSDALSRIGKINCKVNPCIASQNELHYRNKLQYSIRYHEDTPLVGMLERSSHNLVEVNECLIHSKQGEMVYKSVLTLLKIRRPASLRHLLIKNDGALVVLITSDSTPLTSLGNEILKSSCHIQGVIQNINPATSNRVLGDTYHLLAGIPQVKESLLGIDICLSAASFFQVNTPQAESLYSLALESANLTGSEIFLDAYCGVGALTLLFAKKAAKAIGIECVKEAIDDARLNAINNNIQNAEFHLGLAEKTIQKFKKIDVCLLNPPRKGCDELLLKRLVSIKPKTLLYISCNPTTLARDLKFLVDFGYHVDLVQPFDMFPQTAHVETLVRLCTNPLISTEFK